MLFQFDTRSFFLIQRGPDMIRIDLIAFRDLKDLGCSRICQCDPAAGFRFVNLMDRSIFRFKYAYHMIFRSFPCFGYLIIISEFLFVKSIDRSFSILTEVSRFLN